ncbi:uncharacterized protein A1O9_09385 [Exophiala aquamarina CBS 119918]|uniref:3-oxoacyl-[acyl-carrier protein] reductase n=1 Tax=Exophiala aquamarina CBS 119918 TaxID=1182545 RepID=A0A072P5E0_9EURO|nr:uncharacterized protein A1O9_09385 [Exophiala aquamarina CBS 119918]KEF54942.1 hypothetical protein A1O9_09385 [Exophiala aquamarina CBS 119918]
MSAKLAGKVAIVTGGAQGFGWGIVRKFVDEGAKVVIIDANEKTGQEAADKLEGCAFVRGDVSERAVWEKALETASTQFGKLDIVVNNAGILIVKKATEYTEEDYERIFRINVKSLFQSSQVVIPYFQKQGGGAFINMSSAGEIRPRADGVWYCATKAAVTNATKALAVEWASHNIRFNSVAPTIAETGMYQVILNAADLKDGEETRKKFGEVIPLNRFCRPGDVGSAVCFLASDEASFITGVQLPVDGGRSI